MAPRIWSSVTVTISSTYRRHAAKLKGSAIGGARLSAIVLTDGKVTGASASKLRRIEIGAHRLDPEHLAARLQLLDRSGGTPAQPAPANRDDHRVEVVDLLSQLQADRARALRHVRTLERMHHGAAFRLDDRIDHSERVVDVVGEDDLGAVAARPLDPGRVSGLDHHHLRRDARFLGGEGGGHRVIAGADGGDPAPPRL